MFSQRGGEKLRKMWSRIDHKPAPPRYISGLPTTVLRRSVFTKIGQNSILLSICIIYYGSFNCYYVGAGKIPTDYQKITNLFN